MATTPVDVTIVTFRQGVPTAVSHSPEASLAPDAGLESNTNVESGLAAVGRGGPGSVSIADESPKFLPQAFLEPGIRMGFEMVGREEVTELSGGKVIEGRVFQLIHRSGLKTSGAARTRVVRPTRRLARHYLPIDHTSIQLSRFHSRQPFEINCSVPCPCFDDFTFYTAAGLSS
jgi:hypothetical protein